MSNDNELSRDAAKAAPWWNEQADLEAHVEDDLRREQMATAKTRTKKPIIGVQVITVGCPCGGICESTGGSASWASTMIHIGDFQDGRIRATCPDCGEVYTIPASVFDKKLSGK